MQVSNNGHGQRSAAQWSEIIARYRQSGLGRQDFCAAEGLVPRTFANWEGAVCRSGVATWREWPMGGRGGVAQRRALTGARVRRCGSHPTCAGF